MPPWTSVTGLVEEWFSDDAYGWKEPVEEEVADEPEEQGKDMEDESLGGSTMVAGRKRPVSGFLGGWGASSLSVPTTKPKGKAEKQPVSMAGGIMNSIGVGSAGNTPEKEAEEKEKQRVERVWRRTKEKTVFIAVLPEREKAPVHGRKAVVDVDLE